MAILVEFYGLARQRAGVSELELHLASAETRLADVLTELGQRLPHFGRELIAGGRLHPTLAANLGGTCFVSDPETPLRDGQCLLILSADAGG
jgi:molybdopterin converting factor small subunit